MKFFAIVILIIVFGVLNNASSPNCTDISEELKSDRLAEFERFYRKYTLELIKSQTKYPDPWTVNFSLYRDNSVCNDDKNKFNQSLVHKKSLCPWLMKIITREDRYPSLVKEAHCTCKNCNTKNLKPNLSTNVSYECLPVLKHSIGLVRGKCEKNGIYEWKPTIESFNVACVCSEISRF